MKRLTLLFVVLYYSNTLVAQLSKLPDLQSYTVGEVTSVNFKANKARNKGKVKTEVPPWMIPGDWHTYFFVDGFGTNIWSTPSPLSTSGTIDFKRLGAGPYNASNSYIKSVPYENLKPGNDWKLTYHAIYSAALINHAKYGNVTLAFLHGENKNFVAGDARNPKSRKYNNTIQKNLPINPDDHSTYSGGSPYIEGWLAYNGVISATWLPNNNETNGGRQFFSNELGPIVWPSTAYVTEQGVKATCGLRHPSSIVHGDYVYVYYVESGAYADNIPDDEGCHEGIKVARAPLKDALNPLSYEVFYKAPDGTESWNRSLPQGFTKEKMLDFVAVRGAKSYDIMEDDQNVSQEIRFSVAKVKHENYFVGVQEFIDNGNNKLWKIALRFSADLVHWTKPKLIVRTAPEWDDIRVNYPIFLSSDGKSNTEVDIHNFYIIGTDPGVQNGVNRIHLRARTGMDFATGFRLQSLGLQNSILPNPNTGSFALNYFVDSTSPVEITMYSVMGQQMGLWRRVKEPGKHRQEFNISSYPAGIYLVAIKMRNRYNIYKVLKR